MGTNLFLKQKVAIVTGAARGMGLGIAKKLAGQGVYVVSVDIIEELEKIYNDVIKKVSENPGFSLRVDVSNIKEVKNMVDTVAKKLGRVDILVNAAGILYEELATNLEEKYWDKLMGVNAKGVFLCCKYVARKMMEQKSGKIINISSQQAVKGDIEYAAYAASKAAVLRFTQVLALELAPYNIQANCICPGCTDTSMTDQSISRYIKKFKVSLDEHKSRICSELPLGRMATPEDIASLVSFLSSHDSDYISGAALLITGGSTCN